MTRRIGVVVAALALATPACFGGNDGGAGSDFRAERVSGSVTAQAPGETSRTLEEGDVITPGTALKTERGGSVRLESGGRAIELGEVTEATLVASNKMSLELGRALAEAPGARTMSFDSRGVSAQVTGGAARVERTLGRFSIGVYSGGARIDLLGRAVEVPRLRQLDVAGAVATQRAPAPLILSAADTWDRKFLGDVIDFDANLSQYARGFNAEFASEATSPQFYFSFVSYRNTSILQAMIATLDPADVLVGTIFAQLMAARRGGPMTTHLATITSLRDMRATWGIIAKEQGLDLRDVLRAFLDAIGRGTAPPQTNNNASGGGGPQPTSSPRPTRRPSPGPTASPSPSPTPSPTPTECSVLDRLLGTCDEATSAGSSGGGSSSSGSGCSVLGVLIDPNC